MMRPASSGFVYAPAKNSASNLCMRHESKVRMIELEKLEYKEGWHG